MKFLSEEDVKWQPLDVYVKAKELLNKKEYTVVWRDKYASRRSVGPCQDMARLLNSSSYEGFFNDYLSYANSNLSLPVSKRGCTIDELEEVAYKWMTDSGNPYNLDLKTFYNGVIMHVIIETMMGKIKEREAMDAFIRCGYDIEESSSDEDALMGIDFKVMKDGVIKWLIQIKPISFILGYKPDLILDRKHVFIKQTLGFEKYPDSSYLYLFYNSKDGGKWIYNCEHGSYLFKYADIVGPNGYPLVKRDEILKCQKETITI